MNKTIMKIIGGIIIASVLIPIMIISAYFFVISFQELLKLF